VTSDVAHATSGEPAVLNRRILTVAVVGESLLAMAGWAWARLSGQPLHAGPVVPGILAGVAAAAALAALQYLLLRHAPDVGMVRGLRRLYRDTLRPLFGTLPPGAIAIISVMAGLGEEVLFRGPMLAHWGWLASSVVFGLCHVGGRETLPLGLWAAATGALLAWLAIATGGLLAPMVAHGLYDGLALSYIRWSRE
jgi:uncharacterized protein